MPETQTVNIIKLGDNVSIPDTVEANAALNYIINNHKNLIPEAPTDEKPVPISSLSPRFTDEDNKGKKKGK